jgi:RNA recognition motif-containing protein
VSKAPKAQAQQVQSQAQINPRGIRTIVARNLPRTITDLELRKQFGTHGAVQDIYIPKNTTPGKYFGTIKGFALIKFHTPKDSTKAFLAEKDALFLGGNAVTLEFANQDR